MNLTIGNWLVIACRKKYKDKIIKKIKTGSGEPTERTINHLAGKNKNTKVKNKGFLVSLKSFTKK